MTTSHSDQTIASNAKSAPKDSSQGTKMQFELQDVCVKIGATQIIDRVGFGLPAGSIGCLLGPSGSGKSTLLRAIAGFETINQGRMFIRGVEVAGSGQQLPAEQRRIGMMFQDLALFPHLSVEQNIKFGISKLSRTEANQRVDTLLNIVNLGKFRKRYPHELSGGQQQRVALIRAMAPRPDLLLLDEPFSSQDTELRVQLAQEVREILKADGSTAILVTHDQHEAFAIADAIGVLNEGSLSQWDNAYNLYHTPKDRFVADFIGEGVFICGNILDDTTVQTELGNVKGELSFDLPRGMEIDLLVRPDDIIHDDYSTFRGTVLKKSFRGADHLYTLRMPGGTNVMCLAPSHHDHHEGENIGVRLKIDHLVAFAKSMP